MKTLSTILVLVLLACSVSAYISGFQYHAIGQVRANYQTLDSNNNNNGRFLFLYNARSKTLNYHVVTTLNSVGAINLHGPVSCYNKQTGGTFGQDTAECIANTGPVVKKLAEGITPKAGETIGFQVFQGSITLSAVQEQMFFASELYMVVNTVLTTDDGPIETPLLRGRIAVYDHTQGSFTAYLMFENNRGDFPRDSSKTGNTGFGFLSHNPTTNVLGVTIFSSLKQPGTYILRCDSGTKNLAQDNNPVTANVNFEDTELPLLLDLFLGKSCYIFVTSAEAPNGDVFSWIHPIGDMHAISTGANEVPPVASPYISYHLATFDTGSKYLDIISKHNITDTITGAHVHDADGSVICDLKIGTNPLPVRSYCRLNETHLETLEDGELYINVHTEGNPNGEVRGQLVFASKASTRLMRSSSGTSSSTAIGLGVGLGVGIPLLLLVGVGIFFLAKKGGDRKI